MKNIRIQTDGCADFLFDYPCVDSNSEYLRGKKVSLFMNGDDVNASWWKEKGADVLINHDNKGTSFTNVAVVCPEHQTEEESASGYYRVLDYYIEKLQLLIHKMSGVEGFKHIIVVLPPQSDECSTSYPRMAYYAIYGLVKGLGMLNAPHGLFINGIVLNRENRQVNLKDRIMYLSSNNSCNTVGQVFRL